MLSRLPLEIAHSIFCQVPPWNLPAASLVSRQWQVIAFSILYRTIFFDSYHITNQIVDRINLKTKDSPLMISACVHNLLVDLKPIEADGETLTDEEDDNEEYSYFGLHDLEQTELAMTKLKNLHNIYLGSQWLVGNPYTLGNIRKFIPLQSVELHVVIHQLSKASARSIYGRVKSFMSTGAAPDTVEYPLDWTEDFEDKQLDIPLLLFKMLRWSPNLESLSLSFWNDEWGGPPASWNPSVVFSALAGEHFPKLRTLRVKSDKWLSSTWSDILQFLHNHPALHTVELDWQELRDSPPTVSGSEMAAAMPSVQKFISSPPLVLPLLNSGLSAQLVSLRIAAVKSSAMGLFEPTYSLSSAPEPSLPHLRELHVEVKVEIENLTNLIKRAPALEVLEVSGHIGFYISGSEYSHKYMEILKLVPRLRIFALSGNGKQDRQVANLDAANVKQVIKQATLLCPRLNRINHVLGFSWVGTWEITRLSDEDIDLHYYYQHPYDLFRDIGLPRTRQGGLLKTNPWTRWNQWCDSLSACSDSVLV
ncbi:hypothetical protein FRC12_020070 [Ceratobasidium sp. 428]|nr:hypothetical protein FRC12_020070 [Ceratobasidium sp. 428]